MTEFERQIEELKDKLGKCDSSLFGMMTEYILHYRLADVRYSEKPDELAKSKHGSQQRAYGIEGCIWAMLHAQGMQVYKGGLAHYFNRCFTCEVDEILQAIESLRYFLTQCFDANSVVFKDFT
jgi:G:T-mismatch repair DNA endonuclease (very short patch repair protein)